MTPVARTVGFKPGERNIFFHILTACNLSCRHCYINPAQHGSETLALATIERWLEQFVAPGETGNVIFLGGEPTLHPDLAAAVAHAKGLGFCVTVDSNGYLFHDFLPPDPAPTSLDYLSFSLDGPDPGVERPAAGQRRLRHLRRQHQEGGGDGIPDQPDLYRQQPQSPASGTGWCRCWVNSASKSSSSR